MVKRVLMLLIVVAVAASVGLYYWKFTHISNIENDKKIIEVSLYFSNNLNLEREVRQITIERKQLQNGNILALKIMDELIKGPKEEGLRKTIPKGTKLNKIEILNGTAIVDLSEEFINISGSSEIENLTLYSIVDTLTELIYINKVQFLIDGKKVKYYGQYSIDVPLERDENIIVQTM